MSGCGPGYTSIEMAACMYLWNRGTQGTRFARQFITAQVYLHVTYNYGI